MTELSPPNSSGKLAVLSKPLDEIKYPTRRKRKGSTLAASFSLPYSWNIQAFFDVNFREPITVPEGAIVELHIKMPKARR